ADDAAPRLIDVRVCGCGDARPPVDNRRQRALPDCISLCSELDGGAIVPIRVTREGTSHADRVERRRQCQGSGRGGREGGAREKRKEYQRTTEYGQPSRVSHLFRHLSSTPREWTLSKD